MNQIVKYNYFNPENIKFLNKKQYDSIAKIGLCYHHTPTFKNYISFITPWMFVPFGMGRYENNLNDTKFYLDLSFAGINTDLYLQQFHNILDKIDKYIIYNIRNNLEHLELGHLLPKKNLAKVYTNSLRYNINKDTIILVYCAGGYRSALAAKSLIDLGFNNVFNIGGFDEWVNNGGEVQSNSNY